MIDCGNDVALREVVFLILSQLIYYHRGPGWTKLAAAAGIGWFAGSKFHVRFWNILPLNYRSLPWDYGRYHTIILKKFLITVTIDIVQCRQQKKKLDTKFKSDQKALYQQYYEDVYSLQIQNAELIQALEQLGYKVAA